MFGGGGSVPFLVSADDIADSASDGNMKLCRCGRGRQHFRTQALSNKNAVLRQLCGTGGREVRVGLRLWGRGVSAMADAKARVGGRGPAV